MSGWIRRHRLVAFFVLSYGVAWAGWPFWAAGLLPEPLFLACGPLVAALVVVGVAEGRRGYGALLERMTRWRVGALWWVVALTLPPAMVLATALLNTAAGAPAAAFGGLAWGELALLFGLYLINPLGGALGEEPGWRGYALPRLQADRTPLAAALVLGVLVAGWHLPLVVFGMLGAIGLLSTAAITVVYVWLFNRGRGSALLILVTHALQDSFTFGSLGYSAADTARAEYLCQDEEQGARTSGHAQVVTTASASDPRAHYEQPRPAPAGRGARSMIRPAEPLTSRTSRPAVTNPRISD